MPFIIEQVGKVGAIALVAAGLTWAIAPRNVASAAAAEVAMHLALSSSIPAADTVLTQSPPEIRLVFTQAPQSGVSTVRLTRGPEQLVPTTATAADPADTKQLLIKPNAPLTPGAYRVHWRVVAQDGHALGGTFDFRLTAD